MMNEWISVKDKLPEVSEECLLYYKQYRSDSGSLWNEDIIIGFWSDEFMDDEVGFYSSCYDPSHLLCNNNCSNGSYNFIFLSDNEYAIITHWMPLPKPPIGSD